MEIEKRHRINVALWAYAYEVMDDPLVSDEKYDEVCREINPSISTGNVIMDEFFRNEFDSSTGMWIYKHPNIEGLRQIYSKLTGKIGKEISNHKNDTPPATKQISNMGFKTQVEMKWYLASLGFNVLGHQSEHAGRWCETTFDKECGYIKDTRTNEQITIFYKDLFGNI